MSRIGRKPIVIPDGVKIRQADDIVAVEGPKGVLSRGIPKGIDVELVGNEIIVKRASDDGKMRSLHGLMRTLIANMVVGVSQGFQKALEIKGVGYRGEIENDILKLFVGYSRPVEFTVPEGIAVTFDKQVNMVVSGIDKELVGNVAAQIRALRKPEPYKGKGIRYAGEEVRKKVGKSAGA